MIHCKDVPTLPILRFLRDIDGWGNWYELGWGSGGKNERTVRHAMPEDTPEKVVLAKMRRLIAKGLVDGCPCGCRGDFELTEKGREALRADTPTTGLAPDAIPTKPRA